MSRKQSRRRFDNESRRPIVTVTPPQCPHCGEQGGLLKERGARYTFVRDMDYAGRVIKWFDTRCKFCNGRVVLREAWEDAESAKKQGQVPVGLTTNSGDSNGEIDGQRRQTASTQLSSSDG